MSCKKGLERIVPAPLRSDARFAGVAGAFCEHDRTPRCLQPAPVRANLALGGRLEAVLPSRSRSSCPRLRLAYRRSDRREHSRFPSVPSAACPHAGVLAARTAPAPGRLQRGEDPDADDGHRAALDSGGRHVPTAFALALTTSPAIPYPLRPRPSLQPSAAFLRESFGPALRSHPRS